jgi:hypothetical protein
MSLAMNRFANPCKPALLCWALLCWAMPLAAVTEFRLGGADGTPWQAALSVEGAGTYVVYDAAGNVVRTIPVGVSPRTVGTDTLVDYSGQALQPRFFDPETNIAVTDLTVPEKEIPLPLTGGRVLSNDCCICWPQQQPALKTMFDGDPRTALFRTFTQDPNQLPGFGSGWARTIIVDFGSEVPVYRVRFYPRLGTEDDRLLIEDLSEPQPEQPFGVDSFADNFLAWYDVRIGGKDVRFSGGPCGGGSGSQLTSSTLRWVQDSDPLLDVVRSTRENIEIVVDLDFPVRSARWVTVKAFPLRNWELAEFEIYANGYVEESFYLTQILDFGKPVNWGRVRWVGEQPEGTHLEIRTRTGKTPDPTLYFSENLNGDILPIEADEYDGLLLSSASGISTKYDAENWSFWSPPYDFAAGLRRDSLPAASWQDGTPVLSPGPSQYMQIAIRLRSNFDVAPRLEQLSLQIGETPAAREVIGEIWPVEVESFDSESFTYVVQPVLDDANSGFDRLEILTHTQADAVNFVVLQGDTLDLDEFPPEIRDDRLVVPFRRLQGVDDNLVRLAVGFDAAVLRYGTRFTGWVFDSDDPDSIRQQVKPGNATFRYSADDLSVRTPIGGDLLVDVAVGPNPFTPNGDGRNDILFVDYKLLQVTVDRPVTLEIFDLAGRLIGRGAPNLSRSGVGRQSWDGQGLDGIQVPPGTYVYRLSLGAQVDVKLGIVAVAY